MYSQIKSDLLKCRSLSYNHLNSRFLCLKAFEPPHLSGVHFIHIDVIMNHQFKLPNAERTQKGLEISSKPLFKAFKTPMMFNKMQKPIQSRTEEVFVMEEHDKWICFL